MVELLKHFGDDNMVVDCARVSYGKECSNYTEEQNEKLINYLVKHNHIAPLFHPKLQFRITCPIYVERQIFKTSVGVDVNCLAGDSKIRFKSTSGSNKDIEIRELYKIWNIKNGNSANKYYIRKLKDNYNRRNLLKKMKCRVLNEHTGVFEIGYIKNVFKSGIKKTYQITLNDGTKIRCTDEHRIFTDKGWKTIKEGLRSSDLVGKNGLQYTGNGGYQNYENLLLDRKNNLSVKEMSEKYGCSYHTIRKWLKIHKLSFSKEETCFKKNHKPWNKNKSGYKLTFTEKGWNKKLSIAANQPKGELSPLWRGGITSERFKVCQWVRSVAKQVHKKYNYTCQECGCGGVLHAHHIVPVTTDFSKAYDINNLITVCKKCHYKIHNSRESEMLFAEKVSDLNYDILKKIASTERKKYDRRLKVHFVKIDTIEEFGEEETYDIEMDGEHHNFIANGIVVHNSISGRYVDFSDSYTTIQEWRKQSTSSKQGSEGLVENQSECKRIENNIIEQCKLAYDNLLQLGVSKEQARTILPLNLNTTFIWTGSLYALIRLCELRLKPDAQYETGIVVRQMLDLVKNIEGNPFEKTIKAFNL